VNRENALNDHAAELERILTRLMRALFPLDESSSVSDLSIAQMRICSLLADRPRSLSCLAAELGVSGSAATQVADRLERLGMVTRQPSAHDRRVKLLLLTERGLTMMLARRQRRIQNVVRVLSQLSPEERERTLYRLQSLLEATVLTLDKPSQEAVCLNLPS
jgi:MarR family transcriptional regulator for hemolysin